MRFVPLFNFCQVDGPGLGDEFRLVHCGIEICGIETCGIGSFGNVKLGILGLGSDGAGNLGSESLGKENPRFSPLSGSSEKLAETLRFPGAGCSNGLTGSESSAAVAGKL
jgi:hypothetical protein